MSELEITIDGRNITTEKGNTILEICQKNGIHVPTINGNPQLTHALVSFQRKCHAVFADGVKSAIRMAESLNPN